MPLPIYSIGTLSDTFQSECFQPPSPLPHVAFDFSLPSLILSTERLSATHIPHLWELTVHSSVGFHLNRCYQIFSSFSIIRLDTKVNFLDVQLYEFT
jgi:hypothetical protein